MLDYTEAPLQVIITGSVLRFIREEPYKSYRIFAIVADSTIQLIGYMNGEYDKTTTMPRDEFDTMWANLMNIGFEDY